MSVRQRADRAIAATLLAWSERLLVLIARVAR
jgi:hypothetical protein